MQKKAELQLLTLRVGKKHAIPLGVHPQEQLLKHEKGFWVSTIRRYRDTKSYAFFEKK